MKFVKDANGELKAEYTDNKANIHFEIKIIALDKEKGYYYLLEDKNSGYKYRSSYAAEKITSRKEAIFKAGMKFQSLLDAINKNQIIAE